MARMISLYVAGDLVGAPEREVAAHLAACEECRRLAGEFRESSSLLTQACTPPEFGAEFYSGIRSAVLGEIARDRRLSKPSLFRPRWLYATAFAAVVIASGVMLQHFGGTRRPTPHGLALTPQGSGQPKSGQAKETNSSSPPQPSQLPQSPRETHGLPGTLRSNKVLAFANSRRSSRQFEPARKRDAADTAQTALDRRTQIAQAMRSATSASTSVVMSASTSVSPAAPESATFSGGSKSSPSGRASSSQISRIEIQTANPNIRIIWLAPRESREFEETNHDQDQHENGNRN